MQTRKPSTLHFWRGDLPHWQVDDGRYFVTIHLNGAIPIQGQERIRKLSAQYRETKIAGEEGDLGLSRKIFSEMELWLDSRASADWLNRKEIAEIVREAVMHRHKENIWEMFAFVLMPSHVHLFFELNPDLSLKREVEEFKRWTGHQVAEIDSRFHGGRFWQTEWFDHWSRSDEEDDKIIRYIQDNPLKAGLVRHPDEWAYLHPMPDGSS